MLITKAYSYAQFNLPHEAERTRPKYGANPVCLIKITNRKINFFRRELNHAEKYLGNDECKLIWQCGTAIELRTELDAKLLVQRTLLGLQEDYHMREYTRTS